MILDIGPKTIFSIKTIINNSNTVFYGMVQLDILKIHIFKMAPRQILEIISQKTKNDKIFSVAGGGETVAAINKFNKVRFIYICFNCWGSLFRTP